MNDIRRDVPSFYTIGSSHERIGCKHCFKTLDPNNIDPLNQGFIQCRQCNNSFHAGHISKTCPNCGGNQLVNARVIPPPRLKYSKSRRAIELIPIQANGLSSTENGGLTRDLSSYWAVIRHGVRLVALGLLAMIFVATASGLAAYTGRWVDIFQKSFPSNNLAVLLLNAILRQESPSITVFWFAGLASLITAYALFPSTLRNKEGNRDIMRWILRVIGGTTLLIGANVVYFNLNIVEFPKPAIILQNLLASTVSREILLVQFGAIIITTLLAIPYLFITRNPPLSPKYPLPLEIFRATISLIRYLLVFYALVCLIVSIGLIQLGGDFGVVLSFFPKKLNSPTDWEGRIAIMALCATAMGLLIYHIPYYRLNVSLTRPLNVTVRVLGAVSCLVLSGIIYNRVDASLLVESATIGIGLAIAFWPAQRAYA